MLVLATFFPTSDVSPGYMDFIGVGFIISKQLLLKKKLLDSVHKAVKLCKRPLYGAITLIVKKSCKSLPVLFKMQMNDKWSECRELLRAVALSVWFFNSWQMIGWLWIWIHVCKCLSTCIHKHEGGWWSEVMKRNWYWVQYITTCNITLVKKSAFDSWFTLRAVSIECCKSKQINFVPITLLSQLQTTVEPKPKPTLNWKSLY